MILAIDPGISGALALYNPDVDFLYTQPLPIQWRLVNKQKKSEIDLNALYVWIEARRALLTKVILEKPTAMPGAGATSQFNFGMTCGQIEGLIVGLGLPLVRVHPSAWKTAMDVPSDKRRAKGRACHYFPTHAVVLATKTEGECEAAMIALYGAVGKPVKVKTTPGKAPRNKKRKK